MNDFRFAIIDDDPAIIRMVEQTIEAAQLGRVAVTAGDGTTGAQRVCEEQPDVVVIDLLMPGQDGLQTIDQLRHSGFGGAFVMLSHVTDKRLIAEAYSREVEFYISKPLNRTEIVAVLRRVLENMSMRRTLAHIRSSLHPYGEKPVTAPAPTPSPERRRNLATRLLADLGILGEAGAEDLLLLAEQPVGLPAAAADGFEMSAVYEHLAAHYRKCGEGRRSAGIKAIEQRMRRAASAALHHLAALGVEDWGDPRFERLAPTFFDFNEVRTEMARLRSQNRGPSGRVNLKKFLSAFLLELDPTVRPPA